MGRGMRAGKKPKIKAPSQQQQMAQMQQQIDQMEQQLQISGGAMAQMQNENAQLSQKAQALEADNVKLSEGIGQMFGMNG